MQIVKLVGCSISPDPSKYLISKRFKIKGYLEVCPNIEIVWYFNNHDIVVHLGRGGSDSVTIVIFLAENPKLKGVRTSRDPLRERLVLDYDHRELRDNTNLL